MQGVRGDITKLRHVPGLSAAAKRLLQNIVHTRRQDLGAQDVRRTMRSQIQGFCIQYGDPLSSPDKANESLMSRLPRTNRNDAIITHGRNDASGRTCGRGVPQMNVDRTDELQLDIPVGVLTMDAATWRAPRSSR